MGVPVADRWFDLQSFDDDVTLFTEPHVIPLMRCNIWHGRGRDRDLFVDTGMGVASLVDTAQDLLDKPVTAVATHGHEDHIGSHHEFADVLAHPAEADSLEHGTLQSLDPIVASGIEEMEGLQRAGYDISPPYFVTALPAGVALEGFVQKPARVTGLIDEVDVIDLSIASSKFCIFPAIRQVQSRSGRRRRASCSRVTPSTTAPFSTSFTTRTLRSTAPRWSAS